MPEFLGSLIATTRNSRYDPHVGNCSTVQAQNETIVCRYDPVRYNSSRQEGSIWFPPIPDENCPALSYAFFSKI